MNRVFRTLVASALLGSLAACAAHVGPVEVTRFHCAERLSELGQGAIAIVPGPGMDGSSIEFRTYAAAVRRELERIGYVPLMAGESIGPGTQEAVIGVTRVDEVAGEGRSPVSVGVGGSTGSYGSGVGVGIGFNLGGGPKPQVATELSVRIRDNSGEALWEGRAISRARKGSEMAETQLAASRLAESLFLGFPGESGETISVE